PDGGEHGAEPTGRAVPDPGFRHSGEAAPGAESGPAPPRRRPAVPRGGGGRGGAGRAARHLLPHVRRPPVVHEGAGAGEDPACRDGRRDGPVGPSALARDGGDHAGAGPRRAGVLSRGSRERAAGQDAVSGRVLMYLTFYGLKEKPFNATPDPRFLYLTPGHREALAQLLYSVQENRGFLVLTGEVGTGKTTLLQAFLQRLNGRAAVAYVFDSTLPFEGLLEYVLEELGVPTPERSPAQSFGSSSSGSNCSAAFPRCRPSRSATISRPVSRLRAHPTSSSSVTGLRPGLPPTRAGSRAA